MPNDYDRYLEPREPTLKIDDDFDWEDPANFPQQRRRHEDPDHPWEWREAVDKPWEPITEQEYERRMAKEEAISAEIQRKRSQN